MKKNEILDGTAILSVLVASAVADASMPVCFTLIIIAICCQIAKVVTTNNTEYYE